MALSYKRMSDIDLLTLYNEENDLTAYKTLFEKYIKYSRILASEIVEEFRLDFLPDFHELVQVALFSFEIAIRRFDISNTSLKAFWKKIAKNAMMDEVYTEIANHKIASNVSFQNERDNAANGVSISRCFSGVEKGEWYLMDDIYSYLFNPKNHIDEKDAIMFLEYLDTPSISQIAIKFGLSRKTVKRRIDMIREEIIINVLGEDI